MKTEKLKFFNDGFLINCCRKIWPRDGSLQTTGVEIFGIVLNCSTVLAV